MVEVFGVCDRRLRSKVSPIPPLAGLAGEMAILFFHTFSANGGETIGGRASAVLSEPLNGGSPEQWVTRLTELR